MNKETIKKIPGFYFVYGILKKIYNYFGFVGDYLKFKKHVSDNRFSISWSDRRPCLGENTPYTAFDRHYVYHPAWAARVLAQTRPAMHIDISSTLHFCSIVSAFIPVKFYDFRPAKIKLDNLFIDKADLMSLPFADNSVNSLSCMHTIEHIGLGRYGDPINPDGDLKALSELERVLAPGGNLLVVVPVGKPKIEYNAHRIYSYGQIIQSLPKLVLKEFSLLPDAEGDGSIIHNALDEQVLRQKYGCGFFWFTK